MLTEKQFEEYLSLRRFEPASPDLAQRIIGKAVLVADRREMGFFAYILEMLAAVFSTRAALSLVVVLVLGIMIGLTLPVQGTEQELALMEEDGIL